MAWRDGRVGRFPLLSPVGSCQTVDGCQAGSGGLLAAVAICSHAFCQGHVVGRCRVSRRAERPARAGARGLGGSDYTFRVDATDGANDSFALCLWTGAEVPHPRVGTTDNQVPLASGTVRMST